MGKCFFGPQPCVSVPPVLLTSPHVQIGPPACFQEQKFPSSDVMGLRVGGHCSIFDKRAGLETARSGAAEP